MIFLYLLLMCSGSLAEEYIKMIDFSSVVGGNDTATLNVTKDEELSGVFTICFSHLQMKNIYGALIQIQDNTDNKWMTLAFYMENKNEANENSVTLIWLRIGSRSERLGDLGKIALPKWFFSCLKIDTNLGTYSFRTNGVSIAQDVYLDQLEKFSATPKSFSTNIRVGRIVYISSKSVYKSFIGNINIFDGTVDINSIDCTTPGNYLSWTDAKWTFTSGNTTEEMTRNLTVHSVCNRESSNFLLAISAQATYDVAVKNCKNLGNGKLPRSESLETGLSLLEFYKSMMDSSTRKTLWAPYHDNEVEDVYQYEYDPTASVDLEWLPGQPDGGTSQNCAQISSSVLGYILDNYCTYTCRYLCEFEELGTLKLKGLCYDSVIDTVYSVVNDDTFIKYNGYIDTDIVYNMETQQWNIMYEEEIVGTSSASQESLLLGNSDWLIFNNSGCSNNQAYTTEISLSFCTMDEFNCGDGDCISLEKRCDGQINCPDSSDEADCAKVVINEDYNSNISPLPSSKKKNVELKTDIAVSVDIQDIIRISEIDGEFEIKSHIWIEWFDPRLQFKNLKWNTFRNTLSEEEADHIWTPVLIIDNIKEIDSVRQYKEDKIRVNASKYGYTNSDYTDLRNSRVFQGSLNSLVLDKYLSTYLICSFDMSWYPFDIQICYINMTVLEEDQNYVNFIPNQLILSTGQSMVTYSVLCLKMTKVDDENNNGIAVAITLGRSLSTFMVMVFLPTLGLDIIGHLTNFLNEDQIDTRVNLNITVVLVLSAMYIAVSDSLPRTNDLKMVDRWLLFSLLLPFFELILQVYIDWERKREEKRVGSAGMGTGSIKKISQEFSGRKRIKYVNFVLIIVKPIIIVLYVIVFFATGMNKRETLNC